MESLDTPTPTTQPYSDSRNSPVDPTLFNNKRDSAYSSFSASSNTSDYATVPLRPGEACSMDNLLQSIGPPCRGFSGRDSSTVGRSSGETPDEAQLIVQKSRSLTRPKPRPVEVKERPSSCCYEDERRGGDFKIIRNGEREAEKKMNPPQPPTRKDSFRATRSRPNAASKRCVSAPIEISCVPCYYDESKSSLNVESGIHNGFPAQEDDDKTDSLKGETLGSCCLQRQTEDSSHIRCDSSASEVCNLETTSDHLTDSVTASRALVPPGSSSIESSIEVQEHIMHSQTKHSSAGLHRHSAPEKLLATQLQLLQFHTDSSSLEPYNQPNTDDCPSSPCSTQWSPPSLQPTKDDQEAHNHLQGHSNKWEGSRSSTPGSVFLEGDDDSRGVSDRLEGMGVNGGCLQPTECQHPWGRSVSVPGEPTELSVQARFSSDQILERDFQPLSAAASVDTLLEEQRAVDRKGSEGKKEDGEANIKKSNSSRNHRRNRRRSERFATNLRNEIQRKKAQLQRSHGPGGLLCSGETVQEEEGPELIEEGAQSDLSPKTSTKVAFASPVSPQDPSTTSPVETAKISDDSNREVLLTQPQSTVYTESNNTSRSVQILDPGVPTFGVSIRVVEEPAPAGKARRWRWTPEHKLQPEPDRGFGVVGERVLGVTGSRHGVCAFTSSSSSSHSRSSSCSRKEESDILPFADRRKFFEETSKGMPTLNVSSLTSRKQKKTPHHPELQGGELGPHPTQRRYSYQGGIQQESPLLPNTLEARRMSVSSSRDRQKEKEREEARLREERAREMEERLKERERQQQKEKQEMELEMKSARLREIQQERDQEERVRLWERERERELQLEREREMERAREAERLRIEREKELEREIEKLREEDAQLASRQLFYGGSGIIEKGPDFQHKDNFHSFQSKPEAFSHSQTQNQVSRSAFHPVSQPRETQQPLHQGYTARSCTPTEVRMLTRSKTPVTWIHICERVH